jgi:hypothetical protein
VRPVLKMNGYSLVGLFREGLALDWRKLRAAISV